MASIVISGDTSGTVTLSAPTVAGTQAYTLPTAVPAANGYALTSTTGGTMSWAAVGTSATPTALGTVFGATSTAAPYTTSVGKSAGNAVSGNENTFVGYSAGTLVSTGTQNTIVGSSSTAALTTGSNNTLVGFLTNVSSASASNQTVIGASITSKGDNTAFLGGTSGAYNGANTTTWATTSDQRLKKNIADNNVGLDAIKAIQVRNFEYRLPEEVDAELSPNDAIDKTGVQLGVIAQELQTVLPDCVKQESTGVLGLQSDNLTWYMVNAIKQLSTALDAANARIAALEAK